MRIVSLFSGAGGLDLGFIQAGHRVIWANDLYADAVETYRANDCIGHRPLDSAKPAPTVTARGDDKGECNSKRYLYLVVA